MGLVRLFAGATGLGQLIIRNLGDTGGPPTDRVSQELDNIIAWAKLSSRCIKRDTAIVGNVGAGLDVLHTFSLPAASLATDGDYLHVIYGGTFTANDTDKRVNGFFGGTGYEISGVIDIDGAVGWRLESWIIRLTSTSVRVNSLWTVNALHVSSADVVTTFGTSSVVNLRSNDITGLANLNSNATTMEAKGEGAANNDVTQNLTIIELNQQ